MAKIWIILAMICTPALADEAAGEAPISGYEFMAPGTQQLQDDDFLNPAFFLIENGHALWDRPWGEAARSCRSCHDDPNAGMRGVAAGYPKYDKGLRRFVNLEMKINSEISQRLGGEALNYEGEELLALTTLITYQSRSMPMAIARGEESKAWIDWGREIYFKRRGQLNLSCRNCHDEHWGDKLRGDVISQGHINAFPLFRLTWGEVGSRHRIFTWCMTQIRAEPYAFGSDEYLALEAYLAVRGEGLLIEAPGVRR